MNNQLPDERRRLSKRRPLNFISDDDTNSIIVVGADAQQLKIIEDLIDLYDVPESKDPKAARVTKTITVKYSRARVIADAVKDVYRDLLSVNDPALQNNQNNQKNQRSESGYSTTYVYGSMSSGDSRKPDTPVKFKELLSVGVDELSNTLVVSAAEGLFENIEATIRALDEAARPVSPKMQVLQLRGGLNTDDLQKRLNKMTTKPIQPQQPRQPRQQQQQPNVQEGGGVPQRSTTVIYGDQ